MLKHDDKLLKFSDSEEDECNGDNESTEEQSEERDITDEVSICLFVILCLSPKIRFFKLQIGTIHFDMIEIEVVGCEVYLYTMTSFSHSNKKLLLIIPCLLSLVLTCI